MNGNRSFDSGRQGVTGSDNPGRLSSDSVINYRSGFGAWFGCEVQVGQSRAVSYQGMGTGLCPEFLVRSARHQPHVALDVLERLSTRHEHVFDKLRIVTSPSGNVSAGGLVTERRAARPVRSTVPVVPLGYGSR